MEPRTAFEHWIDQAMKPGAEFMGADNVIEDDLQRPRSRQAHHRLDQHGQKDDSQRTAIGTEQTTDKTQHEFVPEARQGSWSGSSMLSLPIYQKIGGLLPDPSGQYLRIAGWAFSHRATATPTNDADASGPVFS